MAALITTDLHLTEDPSEEYRWGLFKWLRQQIRERHISDLFILGDLTDVKDRHGAVFVNRVVREIVRLRDLAYVHILRGNHDCIDPKHPFFGFLDHLENVEYYRDPAKITLRFGRNVPVLMLPHSRNPAVDFAAYDFGKHPYVFMHQTVDGSKAENDAMLSGVPRGLFNAVQRGVYSGDVHVPQNVGKVTYVGSPYHVHFGDKFVPRVLLLLADGSSDLHFPTISKRHLMVTSWDDMKTWSGTIKAGDHVQVTVTLPRHRLDEWPEIKRKIARRAERREWQLATVAMVLEKQEPTKGEQQAARLSPKQLVKEHARANKLDRFTRDTGLGYVE